MTPHPEAVHTVPLRLGEGIWQALQECCRRTGDSLDHVIRSALPEALELDLDTIYQVSTAGALVQGVFQGCVQVADLLRHGDFGLGTFDGLDGEGILLEGRCWQARADGRVVAVPPQTLARSGWSPASGPIRPSSWRRSASAAASARSRSGWPARRRRAAIW